MTYNLKFAEELRKLLIPFKNDIQEKKMFGGLSFLYKGKMSIGVVKNQLVVRIIEKKMELELSKTNVHVMDFTKRPMKEFVFVDVLTHEDLSYWIKLGIEHAIYKLNQ